MKKLDLLLAGFFVLMSVSASYSDGWTISEALPNGTSTISTPFEGRCGPHKTFSSETSDGRSCYILFPNCKGSDDKCAILLSVSCTLDANFHSTGEYEMWFYSPCPMCGKNLNLIERQVKVVFELNTDRGLSQGLELQLPGHSDKDAFIWIHLTSKMFLLFSQSRSIMLSASGSPTVYTEPRMTTAAFAWLAAACKPPQH